MSLPSIKAVKDVMEGLLGRDVDTEAGDAVALDTVPAPTVAVYVDPQNQLASVVLMDLDLTCYVGAALGLVPKGGADASIEDGVVADNLHENTAEVLNVLAQVLADAAGVHQRLYAVYAAGDPVPGDAAQWAGTLGSRRDLQLDVKGYGGGGLSIVSAVGA
ncbi:hypothetical protein [Thalassiella azotivora]